MFINWSGYVFYAQHGWQWLAVQFWEHFISKSFTLTNGIPKFYVSGLSVEKGYQVQRVSKTLKMLIFCVKWLCLIACDLEGNKVETGGFN